MRIKVQSISNEKKEKKTPLGKTRNKKNKLVEEAEEVDVDEEEKKRWTMPRYLKMIIALKDRRTGGGSRIEEIKEVVGISLMSDRYHDENAVSDRSTAVDSSLASFIRLPIS